VKSKVAILAVLGVLACAGSTPAQTRTAPTANTAPAIAFRPFFLATFQDFAAQKTFKAVFGSAAQPFFGGGLDIAFRNGIFVDLTASRFSRSGQRAFLFNGQSYQLGIPLTATEVPLEVTGGYRFAAWHRIRPYAGGGFGSYSYKETSVFSASVENVDVRHAGYLVVGGVEVRVNSWVAVAIDVQWTHVPGILGTGGLSQSAGLGGGAENDLGGIAPRLRVIIGH
jgi:opacity protein-like surface antigen